MRYSAIWLCAAFLVVSWSPLRSEEKAPPSVETLVKQLENSAARDRVEAATALGKLGLPASAAVDELEKRLSDADPNVRGAAARAIGEIGPAAKKAAPELLKMFTDSGWMNDEEPLWHIAATAYGKLGPDVLPTLLDQLDDENTILVYATATAIHQLGPAAKPAVSKLIAELRKKDAGNQIAFIYALMGIGPGAGEAVPALIETTRSDDFHTRYWSCRAIGKIGLPAAKEAVPVLIKLLEDSVPSVRGNAVAALGNLGPDIGPEAIPAITKAVGDKLYNVRSAAIVALGQMGPQAIGSVPQIESAMASKTFAARSQAAIARWQVTGEVEPTIQVLLAELDNHNSPWDAAQGFEKMGKAAAPAVDRLVKLLDAADRETRIWSASSLAAVGAASKPALPKLNEMLKDQDEEIREVVAETIRLIEQAKS